jgi:hypothetical protein
MLAFLGHSAAFAQQPANSKVALLDSFDQTALSDQWKILKGQWKLADGALVGTEQPKDKHSAVIRHKAETGNAVYEFKFMLSKNTESLEFGFDQVNDATTSNASLFSLRITSKEWSLLKHPDEATSEDSSPQVIAKQTKTFAVDRWYSARLTTWGPYVTAKIDNRSTLTGSAQTFATKKPTIVFRTNGGPVEIDDIQVWTQR